MANNGVLFLDELPEFPRQVLEALRIPIEAGEINIARAKGSLSFPAKFSLIAAMNPCPCGFFGDNERECACGPYEILRYQRKISGPLLDRIDLQIRVSRIPVESLRGEPPAAVDPVDPKKIVSRARAVQTERFQGRRHGLRTNADMDPRETEEFAALSSEAESFLENLRGFPVSPRGYYRLLKTARTIADIENKAKIGAEHLAEAWSYRLRE